MQLPEADRYTHSKPFIETQIAILMGGRIAEELFLRQMTSGASNDIERATSLRRKMVCELGMSPLGPAALPPARRTRSTTIARRQASAKRPRGASMRRFALW
jgi:ATP-dependent Zn protease